MKKSLIIGVATLAALVASSLFVTAKAHAYSGDTWIDHVSSDGSIIVMADGGVWRVEDTDQADSALWLPADDIVFLEDSHGRCVYATSVILYNLDESEMVCARKVRQT